MQRPEIRIISQEEIKNTDVDLNSIEAQQLLLKYKIHTLNQTYIPQPQINNPNIELTFDEMVAIEENKLKSQRQQAEILRQQELNKPQPYSFDKQNVKYHNTKFESLNDQFGIQIQIVSDMPIDKGYGY